MAKIDVGLSKLIEKTCIMEYSIDRWFFITSVIKATNFTL